MSDEKLPFQLDILEYDWLILGTGYEESLYSAHLSKVARNSALVLDFGNSYSNNTRTMNFKEFHKISEDLPTDEVKPYLNKRPVFRLMELNEQQSKLNEAFAQKMISGQDFKHFNIDMQPKLLFSHSPTVDLMQQADMDQYMDFKAVEMQYFYDQTSKTFKETPTSKSDIFKCQFLSLAEKKLFFQLLHTLVKVYHKVINYQIDQNSTQEFDQNTSQLDEETYQIYLANKDQPAITFLDQITKTGNRDKIYSIIFYSICFQTHSYQNSRAFTTENLIVKLGKYIKSMGVHSKSPFLYTNYGTGDIPQGFCRISAVYGSVYITQSQLRIYKIEKTEDDKFSISSNLHENPITINKGILMSPQIYDSYKITECNEKEILMRLILVTTKDPSKLPDEARDLMEECSVRQDQQSGPSLYVIPCKIFSEHPIYIFKTDHNTNSSHKDYELFYCWTLLGKAADKLHTKETLRNIVMNQFNSVNYICYEQCLLQEMTAKEYKFQPDEKEKIFVTIDDNDDLDFDSQSQTFKRNIYILNNSFETGFYMIPTPDKQVKQPVEQEIDNQEQLLNQLLSMQQKE